MQPKTEKEGAVLLPLVLAELFKSDTEHEEFNEF